MTRNRVALRYTLDAIEDWKAEVGTNEAETFDPYVRDPFRLLDEGKVRIPDALGFQDVPFYAYDHQKELIAAWIDLALLAETGQLRFRNAHEEKSRQMGVSWIVAWVITWALTFHSTPGLCLSKKRSDIDDGGNASTTDSLFGRIRYMAERLPLAFRPYLHYRTGNDSIIRNPARSGAYVIGEGAIFDPGRGGRYGFVFLDEAARIPWSEAVHTSVSRACPDGRLYNSTPFGLDNVYARLRAEKPGGYSFLRHHWSVHPIYGDGVHVAGDEPESCELCDGTQRGLGWTPDDPRSHRYPGRLASPWYEAQILDMSDEEVATELDIDYERSLTARVYVEFSQDVHVIEEGVPFEPLLPVELAWDYGIDTTAVVVCQDAPLDYRVIGLYEAHDSTPEEVARGLRGYLLALGVDEELLALHYTEAWLCRGDPAGDARDLGTGRPLTADYRRQGFNIGSQVMALSYTVNAVKRLLRGRPKPLRVSPACAFPLRLRGNRWPTDRLGRRKPDATAPQNDEHNHACRAFSYLVAFKFPPPDDRTYERGPIGWEENSRGGLIDPGIRYDMDL